MKTARVSWWGYMAEEGIPVDIKASAIIGPLAIHRPVVDGTGEQRGSGWGFAVSHLPSGMLVTSMFEKPAEDWRSATLAERKWAVQRALDLWPKEWAALNACVFGERVSSEELAEHLRKMLREKGLIWKR